MPSQASRQAPGEPGRQKMKVAPATPAVARLCTVDAPILAWLSIWKAMEKPSMRFSNSGSIASGVTSRPVKPVPPVVMTTSTPSSAIHVLITARIASTSSVTISRAASLCPAAVSRSASVAPDLSSASERVSEIVSTAMSSGMNCFDSSIEDIANPFRRRKPGNDAETLQRRVAERIAGLERALLIAGHEPLLALRSRAVGERIRHHASRRLPLQRVVADRRRRRQRRVDVAGLEEVRTLLGFAVDPDARQAVRLQFDPHLQRIGLRLGVGLLLQPRHARDDAEQVLHVMAGFMRDDIGGGEFAGAARAAAKAGLHLAEETGVQKDRLVGRAVE